MRTRAGKASVVAIGMVAAIAVLGACSDDGGGSAEEDLLDDPSVEDCQDAVRTFFDRVEIPDGFDPSDGVDEDELAEPPRLPPTRRPRACFDPADDDHPCNVAWTDVRGGVERVHRQPRSGEGRLLRRPGAGQLRAGRRRPLS